MSSLRLFFAIPLAERFSRSLGACLQATVPSACHDNLSWIPTANYHLTLAFLGNTAEQMLEPLLDVAASSARHIEPFELVLEDLCFFPNARSPRHLVFLLRQQRALLALHKQLEHELELLGIKAAGGYFRPHVTVARVHSRRSPGVLGLMQDVLPDWSAEVLSQNILNQLSLQGRQGQWVDSFELWSSELHPEGSIYTSHAAVPLRG